MREGVYVLSLGKVRGFGGWLGSDGWQGVSARVRGRGRSTKSILKEQSVLCHSMFYRSNDR